MRNRWGCLPTIELQGGGAKKSDRRPPDVVQWTAGQKGNTYEDIKIAVLWIWEARPIFDVYHSIPKPNTTQMAGWGSMSVRRRVASLVP